MKPGAWVKPSLLVGALAIVGVVAITRRAPPPPPRSLPVREVRAVRELAIPNVGELPKLDGELDDAIWHLAVARTGPFLNEQGAHARPYSDARIAWAHDHLILALYAGDEDIRTSGPTKDLFSRSSINMQSTKMRVVQIVRTATTSRCSLMDCQWCTSN